jgi:hypothetical protein
VPQDFNKPVESSNLHDDLLHLGGKMNKLTSRMRRQTGSTMIELGPTLWIVFIMFTFPLIAFGTIGIRYVLLLNEATYAAEIGAQSSSYTNARNTVTKLFTTFNYPGIALVSQNTNIVGCPIPTTTTPNPTPTVYTMAAGTAPLSTSSAAANYDSSANIYNCQVVVVANLSPLMPGTKFENALVNVPGLNAPIPITINSQKMFEQPSGLTQ